MVAKTEKKIKSGMKNKKVKRRIFVWSMLIFPIIQFLVFYVYTNFSQILMTFQETYIDDKGFIAYKFIKGNIFKNYIDVVRQLFQEPVLKTAFKNTCVTFIITSVVGLTLPLVFSSYMYHKRFLSNFFKLILFLPNIVSMLVFVTIFKGLNERAIPQLLQLISGEIVETSYLLKDPERQFMTVYLFTLFFTSGTQLLSYSGAMSGISESIQEAATLDGFNTAQEFIYITIPMIWPTVMTFITIQLASFFSGKIGLTYFFGTSAEEYMYTYGYYFFVQSKAAVSSNHLFIPLSTMGVIFSCILTPIVFTVRKLLKKYGPSVD